MRHSEMNYAEKYIYNVLRTNPQFVHIEGKTSTNARTQFVKNQIIPWDKLVNTKKIKFFMH